jgi:hypothetical protein
MQYPEPAMAPENTGPVFIVGAPRSGTTLLQYMLRSHPRISLPTGESHFFIPLYRDAETYGDLSRPENIRRVLEAMYRQSADFLDTDLHGLTFDIGKLTDEFHAEKRFSMQSIIAGLFEKNAALEGKARWGDKTPYYILHIPKLLEWFPNGQIIHLIRDGRDVALSLFARSHDFGVYNTYFAAKYWQQYVETGHAYGAGLPDNTYLEIRYEDILGDQRAVMQQICHFLGEEFSESLLNFKKAGQAGKTPLLQKPVQASNAEKWRERMSNRQIRVFESAAGDTLSRFGYPLLTGARPLPLALRAAYRAHNKAGQHLRRLRTLRNPST